MKQVNIFYSRNSDLVMLITAFNLNKLIRWHYKVKPFRRALWIRLWTVLICLYRHDKFTAVRWRIYRNLYWKKNIKIWKNISMILQYIHWTHLFISTWHIYCSYGTPCIVLSIIKLVWIDLYNIYENNI